MSKENPETTAIRIQRVPPGIAEGTASTDRYRGPANGRQLTPGCYHIKKAPGR